MAFDAAVESPYGPALTTAFWPAFRSANNLADISFWTTVGTAIIAALFAALDASFRAAL